MHLVIPTLPGSTVLLNGPSAGSPPAPAEFVGGGGVEVGDVEVGHEIGDIEGMTGEIGDDGS
jgi:hypothetical protein